MKVNQSGVIWENFLNPGDGLFYNVTTTHDGGILAVGSMPAVDPNYQHSFMLRYDSFGNLLWEYEFESDDLGRSYASEIEELEPGTFLVGGMNELNYQFGCQSIGRRAWFVKFRENLVVSTVSEDIEKVTTLSVSPNPSLDEPFIVRGSDGVVVIYDLMGRKVDFFYLQKSRQVKLFEGVYSLVHENGTTVRAVVF
ncbi:MAG: hypothetical protein KBC22_02025 [Candidatus Pacebacteria bacterium]|nr:hypothetical protein [Candidatus Paceibacterota bacterium]